MAYLEIVKQDFGVFQSVVLFKSEHLPIKKSKTAETTTQNVCFVNRLKRDQDSVNTDSCRSL